MSHPYERYQTTCRIKGCNRLHHRDMAMCSTHMMELPPDRRMEYYCDPSPELRDTLIRELSGHEPQPKRKPRETHFSLRMVEIDREIRFAQANAAGFDAELIAAPPNPEQHIKLLPKRTPRQDDDEHCASFVPVLEAVGDGT